MPMHEAERCLQRRLCLRMCLGGLLAIRPSPLQLAFQPLLVLGLLPQVLLRGLHLIDGLLQATRWWERGEPSQLARIWWRWLNGRQERLQLGPFALLRVDGQPAEDFDQVL